MKGFKQFLKNNISTLIAAALFAAFFLSGLFTIGTFKSPTSAFKARQEFVDSPQTTAVIEVSTQTNKKLKDIYIHIAAVETSENATANITVRYGSSLESTGTTMGTYDIKNANAQNANLFNWQPLISGRSIDVSSSKYYTFTFKGDMLINEIVFLDSAGELMTAKTLKINGESLEEGKSSPLTDEQSKFNLSNSYRNTVTQRESYLLSAISNLKSGRGYIVDGYANALGVLIVATGTSIFGANTFGLRFMPFLFNAATVVLLFFIGRQLIKNKTLALLLPVFFVLSAMAFSVGRYASVIPIYTFFALLSIYYMYKFFTIATKKRPVSYTVKYLILSGGFYTLSLSVCSFALFLLPINIILFVAAQARQNKNYAKVIAKNDGDSKKTNQLSQDLKYKKKAGLLLSLSSFVLLPIIFLTLIYIPFYNWLGNAYKSTGFFGAINSDLFKAFSFEYVSAYETVSSSSFFGWFINYRPSVLFDSSTDAQKIVMTSSFNLILAAACLFAALSSIIFMLTYTLSKRVTKLEFDAFSQTADSFLCIILGLVFFTVPFALVKNSQSILFYTAAPFYIAALLQEFDRAIIMRNERQLLKYGKRSLSTFALIITVIIAINFIAIIPAQFAIPVNYKYLDAFSWLISLKANVYIK